MKKKLRKNSVKKSDRKNPNIFEEKHYIEPNCFLELDKKATVKKSLFVETGDKLVVKLFGLIHE